MQCNDLGVRGRDGLLAKRLGVERDSWHDTGSCQGEPTFTTRGFHVIRIGYDAILILVVIDKCKKQG